MSWLVGCAGGLTKERLVTLEDAIQAYASGVRWQHQELLSTLIRPQNGQPKPISQGFWDNVRVTGYEIHRRQLSEDALTAEVTIEFDYYHPDDSLIRKHTTQQSWWYEVESRRWFLDGGLPNFAKVSSSY
ncbi:hypothetical protein E3U44_13445 [Nitrosococcus wardiae]|uniref:Uncharacterized protein n=1 Tax=Nitrosococcus wardiae TaxID=1814290 RepID=A0A4P7C1U3_9GAMM|nr:hypothetical protein E3U44_13445 [Nitrosococcus wardiae]